MSVITVNPVGKSFDTNEGETILDAALRSGILLKHGCRDGRCGDCRAPATATLPKGAVSYPDGLVLQDSDQSGVTVLCCQAIPHQDLTIDAPEVTEFDGISVQKLVTRVWSKEKISSDVIVMKLMLAPGCDFPYMPGQYVDLTLPNGITRSYSMATNEVESRAIELHIRLLPGGSATPYIFEELDLRRVAHIQGPYGSFYLRESETPIIMLASGTGFAPIKALMEQLISTGNERSVTLYWGGRSSEDLYMQELCLSWVERLPWFNYVPVVSDSIDEWTGRTGYVHQAIVDDFTDLSNHQVYACGAPIVIESARRDLTEKCALPIENFYSDTFI